MTRILIDIKHKHYQGNAGQEGCTAISDLHMELEAGEFACLTGPSGCGKTTLLNVVAGIDTDFSGNIQMQHTEEYKEINGILFPYKEFHVQNGQRVEEITYEKIEVNIKMPEGIFDIPEEVKAIMNKNETEPHAQQ